MANNILGIQANGQTIVLNITTESGAAAAATVSGSPITFPYTLTTDTSVSFAADGIFTVSALVDGVETVNKKFALSGGASETIAPTPTREQLSVTTNSFYSPNQRGAWAISTAYALGDLVVNPTGDLVTPKVAFTSGGSYVAANWNIVVPFQKQGSELAGAESTANAIITADGAWHDIAGMTMTVPAGQAWNCEFWGLAGAAQGTAATDTSALLALRCVDSATATTVYGFCQQSFLFPTSTGNAPWSPISFKRRQAALGSSTAVKLQGNVAVLTGLGNTGLFPGALGSSLPASTLQAIGR